MSSTSNVASRPPVCASSSGRKTSSPWARRTTTPASPSLRPSWSPASTGCSSAPIHRSSVASASKSPSTRPLPRSLARLLLLVRDLPRQLSVDDLSELFEGRTRLVEKLAQRSDPLADAHEVIQGLSEEEKLEALNAHPAIGAKTLSRRSTVEQGANDDPETLAELERLNREYEERFGFRFVVFVNRRPKNEIVPVLRERLTRSRDEELDTAIEELVAIAEDRWRRS